MSGGVEQHFANTEGIRAQWITDIARQPPQSRGFAHFHYRKFLALDVGVARFDFATERPTRLAFQPRTAQGMGNYFRRSLAAIRHRHHVDRGLG